MLVRVRKEQSRRKRWTQGKAAAAAVHARQAAAAAAHLVERVEVHSVLAGLGAGKVVSPDCAEAVRGAVVAFVLRELCRGGEVPVLSPDQDGAGGCERLVAAKKTRLGLLVNTTSTLTRPLRCPPRRSKPEGWPAAFLLAECGSISCGEAWWLSTRVVVVVEAILQTE